MTTGAEQERIDQYHNQRANWKYWGPYVSERAWGTVREDYSPNGDAWNYLPHDHARSRAYRWNEDGLGGICDRDQYLLFSLALWNGKDPILKERIFGLSPYEGNHGEDVKEYYYYLDSTPTHSYMKMLYKYPISPFPYEQLVAENKKRTKLDPEYELMDTGVFDNQKYFDVFIEYAKADLEDMLIKLTIHNRSAEKADLHIIPQLWFRNTWSWGQTTGPLIDLPTRPMMRKGRENNAIHVEHSSLGKYHLFFETPGEMAFTENETDRERLFKAPNLTPHVKDAFHRYIIKGEKGAVNPDQFGTKGMVHYQASIDPQGSVTYHLRLCKGKLDNPFENFNEIFEKRLKEADEFYQAVQNPKLDDEEKNVQRQALAGMLWSKQLYYYDVKQWLQGDPHRPPPPVSHLTGRNSGWDHLAAFDVICMPDKWEYPWFASWDLAFHCLPLSLIDTDFAKRQLVLMTREWYLHPNGELPAYEWNFSDANPPVHAWAAWRVFQIDAKRRGKEDLAFLKTIFHKLLLNFTWWVNRKDKDGKNIFEGGFLGLDNISIFDRSAKKLPTGGTIYQSDATSWMSFYCMLMVKISLELAKKDSVYQDMATKFFEHFLRISHAMIDCVGKNLSLWNEEDGFFYDVLSLPSGEVTPLKVRSLVGLLPLLAVETVEVNHLDSMMVFRRRMKWFLSKYPEVRDNISCTLQPGEAERRIIGVLPKDRLVRVLRYMLDENEFLSEFGLRSVSKYHAAHPFSLQAHGIDYSINYEPAESQTGLFGGNSNWRGPVWFPINFLIIESLQKYHHYYGDTLKVEFPTGSGNLLNLWDVAKELSKRLTRLFLKNEEGKRPIYRNQRLYHEDPHWHNLLQFNEYFHGDNGAALGASHQTGWTGLVAKLIQQCGGDLL